MTVTGLPQGIERKVPYIPGKELQCILDGAIYDIPVQKMTTSGFTTTLLHIYIYIYSIPNPHHK